MRDAVDSTIEQEQAELLALADAFFQSRADYFTRTATATLFPQLGGIFGNGRRVRVMSALDGVRSVYQAATGELLAESLPGRPLVPSGSDGDAIHCLADRFNGNFLPNAVECVSSWLADLLDVGALVPEADACKSMQGGTCCGWYVDASHGHSGRTGRRYLVTQAALSACVASAGTACNTVGQLHCAVSVLVEQGWLHSHVLHFHLDGVGALAMYSFDGHLVHLDD